MILYDHPASANCMKPRILLRQLGVDFEQVMVDLFAGETRQPEHLARNPDGRVPVLQLDDGTLIPESGAILWYLAEGTPFLPDDRLGRARVHQWMFFEQNQVEAGLAVARFMACVGWDAKYPEIFADRQRRGRGSLQALERGLADVPFVAGSAYSVADIALYAYVHCGADAGADPRAFPLISAWLDRVEATPDFMNDLEPIPGFRLGRTAGATVESPHRCVEYVRGGVGVGAPMRCGRRLPFCSGARRRWPRRTWSTSIRRRAPRGCSRGSTAR